MFDAATLEHLLSENGIKISYDKIREVPYAPLHRALNLSELQDATHLRVTLSKDSDSVTSYVIAHDEENVLDTDRDFAVMFHLIFDALSILGEDFETWLSQVEAKYGKVQDRTQRVQARALFEYMADETRMLLEFLGMDLFVELTTAYLPTITEFVTATSQERA